MDWARLSALLSRLKSGPKPLPLDIMNEKIVWITEVMRFQSQRDDLIARLGRYIKAYFDPCVVDA
jgi:hypothetical protein